MTLQPCILVVDDDREIRESLVKLLESEGFNSRVAADGKEMFDILSGQKVDVILLDVMLPGQDGLPPRIRRSTGWWVLNLAPMIISSNRSAAGN